MSRFVHCSTAGTCGPVAGRAATEEDEPPAWDLEVPYKRTKVAAERLALEANAVVVNPTTPVGDGDKKPTPTGRMIANVARGRMPAYVGTTGLNIVDVRDVARGHALALEHGEPGQRYLLGGVDLSLADLFAAIARLAGRRAAAPARSVCCCRDGCRRRNRQPGRGSPCQAADVLLIGESPQ